MKLEHGKQEADFALGSPSFAGNRESSAFSRGFGVCICRAHSDLCRPPPQQTPNPAGDGRWTGILRGIGAGIFGRSVLY